MIRAKVYARICELVLGSPVLHFRQPALCISEKVFMIFTAALIAITVAVLLGLGAAALVIRRRQQTLRDRNEAAQLLRRADHLFKVALASQVHTRQNAIARVLLQEALRVAKHSQQLDSSVRATAITLRECDELMNGLGREIDPNRPHDTMLDFPETELIEAQLHLTEAVRVLNGLEKRGHVTHDELEQMLAELKLAQRALDLRLQLRRASDTITTNERARETAEIDKSKLLLQ